MFVWRKGKSAEGSKGQLLHDVARLRCRTNGEDTNGVYGTARQNRISNAVRRGLGSLDEHETTGAYPGFVRSGHIKSSGAKGAYQKSVAILKGW